MGRARKKEKKKERLGGRVWSLLLTSNLVSHPLRLNDGDVIDDSLVEVEVLGEPVGSASLLTFRSTSR